MPFIRVIVILAAVALLPGCASYSAKNKGVARFLELQQPEQALAELEKQQKNGRDRLAYLLNKSMLLRMGEHYKESNATLEEAKKLITELDALSIREQAGAMTINEGMRSYAGEDFEKVLVHLYAALNYLQLDELDNARVESLQVHQRLLAIAEDYKDNKDATVYTEDPYARYLSGIIYEELGEWSNAMIAYRKSYEAYLRYSNALHMGVPEFLKRDLLRLSSKMGLTDELNKYEKTFGIDKFQSVAERRQGGELVVILHNGLAPAKKANTTRVFDAQSGRMVSISLPYYANRHNQVQSARISVEDKQQPLELVENIDAVARQTLQNQMPGLTLRAIARAVAKDSMSRKAKEQGGALVGLLLNIAAAATEVADTRSWLTLPHNILMTRVPLPAGTYTLTLELYGANGSHIGNLVLKDVEIRKRKITYVEKHWIQPAPVTSRKREQRREPKADNPPADTRTNTRWLFINTANQ